MIDACITFQNVSDSELDQVFTFAETKSEKKNNIKQKQQQVKRVNRGQKSCNYPHGATIIVKIDGHRRLLNINCSVGYIWRNIPA